MFEKLKIISKQFPFSRIVWHKAHGGRGIVVGYKICCDGGILVSVSWGGTEDDNYPIELATKPVPQECEGDEWKQPT